MKIIAVFVNQIIGLYILVIFVSVIMSWLIGFNVINRHNQFVNIVWRTCTALTEPLLRPIRNFLPSMGGLDVSPIILLFALNALQIGLNHYIFQPVINAGY